MKLYTKTGDRGETGLIGGERVAKDDLRIAACGAVDELNAVLGLVATAGVDPDWLDLLRGIQADLFSLGACLAATCGAPSAVGLGAGRVGELEAHIDALTAEIRPLRNFVLPGGPELAARLHHARTVCRRAERAVVTLARVVPPDPSVLCYLNRLSDLLFALALAATERTGQEHVLWTPGRSGG